KIKKLDGSEGNLYDYIQYDPKTKSITFNHKEYGVLKEWDVVKPGSKIEKFLHDFYTVRMRTQGNYKDPLMINQGALGRALMVFMRWLPMMARELFGALSEDKTFRGRFSTLGALYNVYRKKRSLGSRIAGATKTFAHLLGEVLYIRHLNRKMNGKTMIQEMKELGLLEVDAQNMAVNARHIRTILLFQIIAMVLLYLALFGADGQDDDDDGLHNTFVLLYNLVRRQLSELGFFIFPNEAMSLVRYPIRQFLVIQRVQQALSAWSIFFLDREMDIFKTGPYKGQSKVFWRTINLIPGISTWYNFGVYSSYIFAGHEFKKAILKKSIKSKEAAKQYTGGERSYIDKSLDESGEESYLEGDE
ncbi:MAG: hypothetical protein NZM44_02500, partial [Candidatus Calescibacterium sp.]|nr:hypothetical protein [Candidatus Calescibacterium sp.]